MAVVMGYGTIWGISGFVAGSIGPLIFTPSATQGQMLGIFITGPFRFATGIVYGAFKIWRGRKWRGT